MVTQVSDHAVVSDPAGTQARAVKPEQRLGWLDTLRGIAALAVVFQHIGPSVLWAQNRVLHHVLDAGTFGVFLFFLVSGYIVPASLERRGDVRAFWVGRIFRIYPLYATVFLVTLLILPLSFGAMAGTVVTQPWLSGAANGLMLQDLLGVLNGLPVAWSLSYEMVFYYLVSALFVLGWHRRSGPIAVGFAVVALVAGASLPLGMLSSDLPSTERVVALALFVVVLALALIISGRPVLLRTGAFLLGGLALTLVFLNSRSAGFDTMMILATMFAGTAINRAEHGQIKRREAIVCCSFVLAAGLVSGTLYGDRFLNRIWTDSGATWVAAYLAAWVVFGLALLLRRRTFPRFLSWLGTVSFALYLIHLPLICVLQWLFRVLHFWPVGLLQGLACLLGFLAVVLPLSYAAHRLVELPGQKLGRRLLRPRASVGG